MAEVYRVPKGVPARGRDPLNWVFAHHRDTLAEVHRVAAEGAMVAEGVLAAHRKTGRAKIVLEQHDVDCYVFLDDEASGAGADALAIEVGAAGGRGGIRALSTAFPDAKVADM